MSTFTVSTLILWMRPRSSQSSWPMIAAFALSVTKNAIFLPAYSPLRCTSSSAVPIGLTLDSPNALRMIFVCCSFVPFPIVQNVFSGRILACAPVSSLHLTGEFSIRTSCCHLSCLLMHPMLTTSQNRDSSSVSSLGS